jgi:hypothetical protein
MYRPTLLATGLLLAMSAFAGQPASAAQATATLASVATVAPAAPRTAAAVATPVTTAAAAAAPATPAASDKVYPPLPSLAMLPPGSDDEDDPPPKPSQRKKKSRAQDRKCVTPTAHMVVSDASHAYLDNIEKQLDLALAK